MPTDFSEDFSEAVADLKSGSETAASKDHPLASLLTAGRVNLELLGTDRASVLRELATMLRSVSDPERLVQALLAREELSCTVIGHGCVVPHAMTELVGTLEVAVGRSALGVDFGACDGGLGQMFMLVVAPPGRPGRQYKPALHRVAAVMTALARERRYLSPATPAEMIRTIAALEQ